MNGEPQEENDLFFVCSLIEYIARKTKKVIIEQLGEETLSKIYHLAEVYHSENIEKVATKLIEENHIDIGHYSPVEDCKYRIPTYWEIGKVYQRLILMIDSQKANYIQTLIQVLSSWLIEKIDNYNSSMYYENPDYIYQCYLEGNVL